MGKTQNVIGGIYLTTRSKKSLSLFRLVLWSLQRRDDHHPKNENFTKDESMTDTCVCVSGKTASSLAVWLLTHTLRPFILAQIEG